MTKSYIKQRDVFKDIFCGNLARLQNCLDIGLCAFCKCNPSDLTCSLVPFSVPLYLFPRGEKINATARGETFFRPLDRDWLKPNGRSCGVRRTPTSTFCVRSGFGGKGAGPDCFCRHAFQTGIQTRSKI